MTRAVSVLEVAEPAIFDELQARAPIAEHLGEVLGPRRRVVRPTFETEALPALREGGARVLIRYARRTARAEQAARQDLAHRVASLRSDVRSVLHAAQRHALDGVVVGSHAWDPQTDAPAVRALYGAGLLQPLPGDQGGGPHSGRYHLNPDLPPPPAVPYDFTEAVMAETEDLAEPGSGPVALLHDLAGLAAAIDHVVPRRIHAGTVAVTDARRLGKRLGTADLAADGKLERHPRWGRALRALEGLAAVSMDPATRELHIDHGLEPTLAGDTADAVDRFVHRLVERDLHVVVPAVRSALEQAGDGAIDELIFLELLRDQHRDVLFTRWLRDGTATYPALPGEQRRPFDDDGFEAVETPLVRAVLHRLERLGVLRRAPGVFAPTADGRRWAHRATADAPPMWVSSDLEVVVPPDAVTPWERYQLERLGRCLARDVVDRYKLDRRGLEKWLSTHELEDALDLLDRRCPAVPATVLDTLHAWTSSAERVVLVRGVLLDDAEEAARTG